jgi:hypothetical protein
VWSEEGASVERGVWSEGGTSVERGGGVRQGASVEDKLCKGDTYGLSTFFPLFLRALLGYSQKKINKEIALPQ